mgnify:CR=1 FL=1
MELKVTILQDLDLKLEGDINLKSLLVKTFPTNKKVLYGKKEY